MQITIQPSAALVIINETEWECDTEDMKYLRTLAMSVKGGEEIVFEVDDP